MYARRAVLATLWIAHAFLTWSAIAIIFTICVLQCPKGWIYNRAPLLTLDTGRDHDHDNSCLCLYLKQPTPQKVSTHAACWFRLDDKLIESGRDTNPLQDWNSTSLYLPKVRLCQCFWWFRWLGQNFSCSRIGRSSGPKTVLWATCSNPS